MTQKLLLRDFQPHDAHTLNTLAVQAFKQFKDAYHDWPAFQAKIATMAELANVGELIIAETEQQLVGAVAYIGPQRPRAEFFRPEWSIIRLLVVAPAFRQLGIGRALAEECLRRAQRDGASVCALHTSGIMSSALSIYQRLGFQRVAHAPTLYGVEYDIYIKNLLRLD